MKPTTYLVAILALFTTILGYAQVNIGDPVIGDGGAGIPASQNAPQPSTPPGDPANGDYSIIVNAYIEAYARVVVYDNWIEYSSTNMAPTEGTWGSPSRQVADNNVGSLYTVDAAASYDLAGGAVESNSRLDMSIFWFGPLTRVEDDGSPFAGVDTRRADNGPYQLATMMKLNLHGRFLDAGLGGPADDASGTQYASPTSGDPAEYNTWTGWDSSGNAGDAAVASNDTGWFWADDGFGTFPWTGAGYAALANSTFNPAAFSSLNAIDLVVERGQAENNADWGSDGNSPNSNRAEWWFASSVMRRGLQDISGNYRQDIIVLLSYREAPVVWAP